MKYVFVVLIGGTVLWAVNYIWLLLERKKQLRREYLRAAKVKKTIREKTFTKWEESNERRYNSRNR